MSIATPSGDNELVGADESFLFESKGGEIGGGATRGWKDDMNVNNCWHDSETLSM